MRRRVVLALSAVVLLSIVAAAADTRLLDAVRNDDARLLRALLKSGADPNLRDDTGTTALMRAAAFASPNTLRLLLDRGADVNAANSDGATALMWATGNTSKVRLLIDRGALVNAKTKDGITALLSATYRRNADAMHLLLSKGADPRAGFDGATLLVRIANATGTPEMRRVLARAGLTAKTSDDLGPSPLADLLFNRIDLGILKEELALGANPNESVPQPAVTVPALGIAASQAQVDYMRLLLQAGADPNRPSTKGWTPLMMAAGRGDLSAVRLLIESGANLQARDESGRTALDWALTQGETDVARALRAAGVAAGAQPAGTPDRVSAPRAARAAVEAALSRLQPIGPTFNQRTKCISCHHESLPQIAVTLARARGIAIDAELARHPTDATLEMWKTSRERFMLGRCDLGGFVANVSFGLAALAEEGVQPSPITDAAATCLASVQEPDGSWNILDTRPPLSGIDAIVYTALTVRALKVYGVPGLHEETKGRLERARQYLRAVRPADTQGHAFKLLGLIWSGSPSAEISSASKQLVGLQRDDGGWSQLPAMTSDAYATGQALYALSVEGMSRSNPVFRKGADYLLRTQLADGTWVVQSRAFGFQRYFETGFPHGSNQFISAAATAWAAIALTHVL